MKKLILSLCATVLLASAVNAANAGPIADWRFDDSAGTTLNNTAQAGTAGNWGLALTGSAANGLGQFSIGNDGRGGSGTRSAYADFDPVSSGSLSLFASFAAWNPARTGGSFTLGFIEGNDFSTAQFSLAATDTGFLLAGAVDPFGDGAALAQSAAFAVFSPLTVRLDLDLALLRYSLAYDLGAGFIELGSAEVDSFTLGVNSLRLGAEGDFGTGQLLVERIWLDEAAVSAVPEPSGVLLALTGLGLMLGLRRRAA